MLNKSLKSTRRIPRPYVTSPPPPPPPHAPVHPVIMAWHLRTVLADALWRSEAGVPLPDHRSADEWVDDLGDRSARDR
ncbi:hypothetical protein GCM10009745_15410 [Kribbella yunnanensis]|uniref:Uncharacterized protein n=1 Tax=Kribbella yunnanensis TaxID=190194 RepID=A0ABN2GLQ9_9ACTN